MMHPAADEPRSEGRGLLRRLAAEPLVQFLVVGATLFGVDYTLNGPAREADGTRIELTSDDVRKLSLAWLAQGRPAPTPAQLKSLVDQKVAMEILVREAKGLGLDQDDEVIKRRLAQKMDFLFEDVARAREPTDAELRDWYSGNAARFAEPPRIDFRHLYFALDRGHSEEDVAATRARIADQKDDSLAVQMAAADPFMFQDTYGDASPEQVARTFGPAFAKAVFALPRGSWQGPVRSGYGWHIVRVDALTPSSVPAFEQVAPQVKAAWSDEQTRTIKQKAFQDIKARYIVVTPPLDDPRLVAPGLAQAGAP
ncbi:MAG: peptidylprolyl isomerase [Alsobacter sp.]